MQKHTGKKKKKKKKEKSDCRGHPCVSACVYQGKQSMAFSWEIKDILCCLSSAVKV